MCAHILLNCCWFIFWSRSNTRLKLEKVTESQKDSAELDPKPILFNVGTPSKVFKRDWVLLTVSTSCKSQLKSPRHDVSTVKGKASALLVSMSIEAQSNVTSFMNEPLQILRASTVKKMRERERNNQHDLSITKIYYKLLGRRGEENR